MAHEVFLGVGTSELTTKALELLASRLSVIEQLEEAVAGVDRTKEQLRAMPKASLTSAWNNALSAGWTKTELRQLNLPTPPVQRCADEDHEAAAATPAPPRPPPHRSEHRRPKCWLVQPSRRILANVSCVSPSARHDPPQGQEGSVDAVTTNSRNSTPAG